jgi:hypothetical protein
MILRCHAANTNLGRKQKTGAPINRVGANSFAKRPVHPTHIETSLAYSRMNPLPQVLPAERHFVQAIKNPPKRVLFYKTIPTSCQ